MSAPKTGERALATRERQQRALDLRKEGTSLDEIARTIGYAGKSGAYKAIAAALRETLQEPADQVRALELQRLDSMLTAIWPTALQGDLKAIETVLHLMDRRARYLGLDQPVRVDVEARIRAMSDRLGLDAAEAIEIAELVLREGRT